MKYIKIVSVAALIVAIQAAAQEMSTTEIEKRIQPVGTVHIAGAQPVNANAGGPRSGADVYNKSCVACHSSGVLGAPKLQDAADWTPRMEKGLDSVVMNAIKGINAMPPKGTCGDCSDEEIKAAVEYMLEGI